MIMSLPPFRQILLIPYSPRTAKRSGIRGPSSFSGWQKTNNKGSAGQNWMSNFPLKYSRKDLRYICKFASFSFAGKLETIGSNIQYSMMMWTSCNHWYHDCLSETRPTAIGIELALRLSKCNFGSFFSVGRYLWKEPSKTNSLLLKTSLYDFITFSQRNYLWHYRDFSHQWSNRHWWSTKASVWMLGRIRGLS